MTVASDRIEKRFKSTAASRTFRNLRTYLSLESRAVLDVGCSYGEFLVLFGRGSVGVTLEPEEVAYGRERGLAIVNGNIEDEHFVQTLEQRFDVIFANNILEHLYAPHTFLTQSKRFLKEGGNLMVGVPCVPRIRFLTRFKKFRGCMASQHINFFTRDTLRLTVERAGWIVEGVRGFRLKPRLLDHLLDAIYPHFYVIARPDPAFEYSEKRKRELQGYHT